MACNNCFDNCGGATTPDKCIKVTIDDVVSLDISKGDSLYSILKKILPLIGDMSSGTGITLGTDLSCALLTGLIGSDEPTLENLMQVYSDAFCNLQAQVTAILVDINPSYSFDTTGLGVAADATTNAIIQALITKTVANSTSITSILSKYVTQDTLCDAVAACISGSGSSQNYLKMIPYVAIPYHGPISGFDATGKGLSSAGWDKVYICNGQIIGTFTTPDYRGRSPLGANTGVPGGSLDSSVDPALLQNAGYNISLNTKKGTYVDTLSILQTPPHSHGVTDPGHDHPLPDNKPIDGRQPASSTEKFYRTNSGSSTTGKSVTGITINSTGSGQPHNTTHPVIGCNFIMYIPS